MKTIDVFKKAEFAISELTGSIYLGIPYPSKKAVKTYRVKTEVTQEVMGIVCDKLLLNNKEFSFIRQGDDGKQYEFILKMEVKEIAK